MTAGNGAEYVGADSVTVAGAGAMAGKDVGVQALTSLAGLTLNNANYTLVGASGSVSVTPATLTYTANAASATYGSTATELTGTVTGFVNGETLQTATSGTPGFSTAATASSNVGSYAITGSGLTANNGNYDFAQAPGNATALTVNPAAVTVTALGGSSTYGSSPVNPGLSATGLQNGQSVSALTGLTNSFGIGATTNVGRYTLAVAGTLTNPNYVVVGTVNGFWLVDAKQTGGTPDNVVMADIPMAALLLTLANDPDQTPRNSEINFVPAQDPPGVLIALGGTKSRRLHRDPHRRRHRKSGGEGASSSTIQ